MVTNQGHFKKQNCGLKFLNPEKNIIIIITIIWAFLKCLKKYYNHFVIFVHRYFSNENFFTHVLYILFHLSGDPCPLCQQKVKSHMEKNKIGNLKQLKKFYPADVNEVQ